jgi:hypothetical protein
MICRLWRVPCQSPEMSPFAWVSVAGAGVAAGADGEVWALAGLGEKEDPRSVTHVSADIARNTDFAVIVVPCLEGSGSAGNCL